MTCKDLIESIVHRLVESKTVSVGPPRNKRIAAYDVGGPHAMLEYVARWRGRHGFGREEFNIAEGNWSQLIDAVPGVFRHAKRNEGESSVYVLHSKLPDFIRGITVALNRSSLHNAKKDAFDKYGPISRTKDKRGITHIGRERHYYGEFDPFYYLKKLRDVAIRAYKSGGDLHIG